MVTDSALQLLPCRRCSLDWCLWHFLSPLYTIFLSPSPLKPCGYFTCLIMMKHAPFSPNLSAVAWYVLRNDLRDLRMWRTGGLPFPFAGRRCRGWVYNNQNQNEYQMAEPCGYCTCLIRMKHVPFSPNLYTTALTVLHVIFTVTFKREGHANWPARLQVELYNGNWKIINKHCISWNMLKIYSLNLT